MQARSFEDWLVCELRRNEKKKLYIEEVKDRPSCDVQTSSIEYDEDRRTGKIQAGSFEEWLVYELRRNEFGDQINERCYCWSERWHRYLESILKGRVHETKLRMEIVAVSLENGLQMTEAATNASGFEDLLKQKDAIIGQKDGMIRRIREDAARSSKEARITKTMDRDHLRSRTDRQREKAPRGRRGQGIPERARVQGKGRQYRGLKDFDRLPCLGARRRESMVKDEKIDNNLFQHYPLNRCSWGYLYPRRNRWENEARQNNVSTYYSDVL